MSELPQQLSLVRAMRRREEEVADVLTRAQSLIKAQEQSEGNVDSETKLTLSRLSDRFADLIITCDKYFRLMKPLSGLGICNDGLGRGCQSVWWLQTLAIFICDSV